MAAREVEHIQSIISETSPEQYRELVSIDALCIPGRKTCFAGMGKGMYFDIISSSTESILKSRSLPGLTTNMSNISSKFDATLSTPFHRVAYGGTWEHLLDSADTALGASGITVRLQHLVEAMANSEQM